VLRAEGRGKGKARSLHFGRDDTTLCLTAIAKYAAGILPSVAEESLFSCFKYICGSAYNL